jgi:hypothetical protein
MFHLRDPRVPFLRVQGGGCTLFLALDRTYGVVIAIANSPLNLTSSLLNLSIDSSLMPLILGILLFC